MPNSPPRALLFAAGLGTRMRPLTDDKPKALVELCGKPLIEHILEILLKAGILSVAVNTYHFADRLVDYLLSRHKPPNITIIREDGFKEPLETEGGLVNALPFMAQGVILTCNCDAIWFDETVVARALRMFDPEKMDALLLLAPLENAIGFDGVGDFFMDTDGRLIPRGEKENAPFAYAGLQITKSEIFANRPKIKKSLAKTWFNEFAPHGRLFGIVLEGLWLHVGDPEALEKAEEILSEHLIKHQIKVI